MSNDIPFHLTDRTGISDNERALQTAWRERYKNEVKDIVVYNTIPSPKLSIIIVSYRPKEYLLDCLKHVRGQTELGRVPFEILLADSGGLEHLRDRTAGLCDVDLRLRDGIPLNAARNAAMAFARGEWVAIVDDDGLVAPTFVEVIGKVFEDSRIAAMRGRILFKDHPYFRTLARHYDHGDAIIDDALDTEGHMAVRRNIYLATGGFPDDFFGGEGVYLEYRIKKSYPDKRVVYVPELLMRHDYMDGLRKLVRKSRKLAIVGKTADAYDPSGEFSQYLRDFKAKKMPKRSLTADEQIARALLLAIRWGATHAPNWALPKL